MPETDDDAEFVSQGVLEPDEAERLLPKLEKVGIRFEIDVSDITTFEIRGGAQRASQITLYVHRLDLDAWEKIRSELYPV